MGQIKIIHDMDGEYGYPEGTIIPPRQLIEDYIDGLNEVEDADTISFLRSSRTETAVDFIADLWGIDYKFV